MTQHSWLQKQTCTVCFSHCRWCECSSFYSNRPQAVSLKRPQCLTAGWVHSSIRVWVKVDSVLMFIDLSVMRCSGSQDFKWGVSLQERRRAFTPRPPTAYTHSYTHSYLKNHSVCCSYYILHFTSYWWLWVTLIEHVTKSALRRNN